MYVCTYVYICTYFLTNYHFLCFIIVLKCWNKTYISQQKEERLHYIWLSPISFLLITISPFLPSSPFCIYFLLILFLAFLKVKGNIQHSVFMQKKRARCLPFRTLYIVDSVYSFKFYPSPS